MQKTFFPPGEGRLVGWPSPQGILMKLPCVYCANRERDVCVECQEAGKFRHLAPETLYNWEFLELPPYYKFMEMNIYEIRALFYLVLWYQQRKEQR